MIDLYLWTTPNGRKPLIMLEETETPYRPVWVDISKGEQFEPHFLKISPNNRIPALADLDTGVSVFESAAILMYLAEKTGRFLPTEGQARMDVLQWSMWQMGGVGPMFGQAYHFKNSAPEKIPYAIKRYEDEAKRLVKVMDGQLEKTEYLGGDYSIADMLTYPWVAVVSGLGVSLDEFPNAKRWADAIAARPAVKRSMELKPPS